MSSVTGAELAPPTRGSCGGTDIIKPHAADCITTSELGTPWFQYGVYEYYRRAVPETGESSFLLSLGIALVSAMYKEPAC